MKLIWENHYVPDGQLEPDEFNRWQRVAYLMVDKKALAGIYPEQALDLWFRGEIPVMVAVINQKGTLPGHVPSVVDKFAACIPQVKECLNTGLSFNCFVYGNTVEEVEKQVELHFLQLINFFKNVINSEQEVQECDATKLTDEQEAGEQNQSTENK